MMMEIRDWVLLGETTVMFLIILALIVQSRYRDRNQQAEFDDLRWKLSDISKQIDSLSKDNKLSIRQKEPVSHFCRDISSST